MTVWLVWDDGDYYGPDPTERFVHATKESAERYVAELNACAIERRRSHGNPSVLPEPLEIEEREVWQ